MIICRQRLTMSSITKVFAKAFATYGIETSNGIFCMAKRVDTVANECPEELRQDIEIFIPDSTIVTYDKLNNLKKLNELLLSQKMKCYKSFLTDNLTFERTTTVHSCDTSEISPTLSSIDGFNKLKFQWNGVFHNLTNTSVDDDFSEYTIHHLGQYHPISDSIEYNVVYSNYEQVLSPLRTIHEHNINLDLSQYIKMIDESTLQTNNDYLTHPFIVVEGLDGTGKSTLSGNLARYLNAQAMGTPPPSISSIRKKFDHLPEIYRRAYYAFSNYLAAKEVLEITKDQPVVMDRFWHSTTAYAIANEIGCGNSEYIPPVGHSSYNWPKDLLYPSAVVFLSTPEKDRDSRVNKRVELTDEEKQLSVNRDFRARIMETYRRISHTKWIEVDTSGTKEETLAKTIKSLKMNGIC